MIKNLILLSLLFFSFPTKSQTVNRLSTDKNTILRGLSVVNDKVAWISGSKGWVARSLDGGKTWSWNQLEAYKNLDFRDVEAFSESKAILVNAGSPAVILLTLDGGKSWKEVYRNDSPDIFLDGMDFWDSDNGLIYGDPINQKMVLLKTTDGGANWENISDNNAISLFAGEASFAASGTNIRCDSKGNAWIATGGTKSRIFHSSDYGKSWLANDCPIIQGKSSMGPFSIAIYKNERMVAVGGDYLNDTSRDNNSLISLNAGKSWFKPSISTFGYRSAVEFLSKNDLIATGPTGTDFSNDGGKTWRNISNLGFHTVRKAKNGKLVLLTGSNGSVAKLTY